LSSRNTFALALGQTLDPIKSELNAPHEIVEIYFKAVSRGELIVSNQILDKSMLVPIRVEYIYELNSAISSIKVYSEFKQPMLIQGQECCKIRGVKATLDADGHII